MANPQSPEEQTAHVIPPATASPAAAGQPNPPSAIPPVATPSSPTLLSPFSADLDLLLPETTRPQPPRPVLEKSFKAGAVSSATVSGIPREPTSFAPNKETARITVLPEPVVKASFTLGDGIPMPWCWTILGASFLTLLIQIWNYFV